MHCHNVYCWIWRFISGIIYHSNNKLQITTGGKVAGSAVIVFGLLIIALPSLVISQGLNEEQNSQKNEKEKMELLKKYDGNDLMVLLLKKL